jgi:glycine cleavage system H protein
LAGSARGGENEHGARTTETGEGEQRGMNVPEDLKYTKEHEWVRVDGDRMIVGITDFAQDALGDVVYVDVPETGTQVKAGEPFGEVESTKSVSDVYAPISGTVVDRNAQLADDPELVNRDPYGEGWMVVISPADASEVEALLEPGAYRQLTETEGSSS